MIVPNARFNCRGRITSFAVSMLGQIGTNLPLFQVWRPTSHNSRMYNKTVEVELKGGNYIRIDDSTGYYYATISLNSHIEVQAGDVIGYYQPSNPKRRIWSTQTSGYTSYSNTTTSPLTSINISNVNNTEANNQPLIKVMFGKIVRTTICIHECLWLYYIRSWKCSRTNVLGFSESKYLKIWL